LKIPYLARSITFLNFPEIAYWQDRAIIEMKETTRQEKVNEELNFYSMKEVKIDVIKY